MTVKRKKRKKRKMRQEINRGKIWRKSKGMSLAERKEENAKRE